MVTESSDPSGTDFSDVSTAFNQCWQEETIRMSKLDTSRNSEGKMSKNMLEVCNYLFSLADTFNEGQQHTKLETFSWCQKEDGTTEQNPTRDVALEAPYNMFGARFGASDPEYKIAIICHLDNVPAQKSPAWEDNHEGDPFIPERVSRSFELGTKSPQDFLVGRGCIDDKGPTSSALIAARCIAKAFDGNSALDNKQVEILLDSSEETDMSTHHYLEDPATRKPDFGIVYDCMWIVRAEKGGERPKFTVPATSTPQDGKLYARAINTPASNSTSTIPDWCTVEITSTDRDVLGEFAATVVNVYKNFEFDDPNYISAEMKPNLSEDGAVLTLTASVKGAQHGSAPLENRKQGANPLVSLANFIAGLADKGDLAKNAVTGICNFIQWTFGTYVFGELHSEHLYRYDQIFEKDNGTTYAVTKITTENSGAITLEIDIRYALGHHETKWDGAEGLLDGDSSVLGHALGRVIDEYNEKRSDEYPAVSFTTKTLFAPDVRNPDSNPYYRSVERAYSEVMGEAAPRYALGGGTDAKGHTFMVAAGSLFTSDLGPPINYHGIGEGAPIHDMQKSTEIMYQLLHNEISEPSLDLAISGSSSKSIARMAHLKKRGLKSCCSS